MVVEVLINGRQVNRPINKDDSLKRMANVPNQYKQTKIDIPNDLTTKEKLKHKIKNLADHRKAETRKLKETVIKKRGNLYHRMSRYV